MMTRFGQTGFIYGDCRLVWCPMIWHAYIYCPHLLGTPGHRIYVVIYYG